MNREPIHEALFAKLEAIELLETASRRLKHWTDVSAADQPALFLTSRGAIATQKPVIGTAIWDLSFDVVIYVNTRGDSETPPSSLLNPILDAIEAALVPDDLIQNKCTFGGLVDHCWIEGKVETDEGALGDQGVAIVPVIVRAVP